MNLFFFSPMSFVVCYKRRWICSGKIERRTMLAIPRGESEWWIFPAGLVVCKIMQSQLINRHVANLEIQDRSLYSKAFLVMWQSQLVMPKLQLSYASRLAKKAELRTIFLFGSEEISKQNVADLIRTAEYALSQLKEGKIPNNTFMHLVSLEGFKTILLGRSCQRSAIAFSRGSWILRIQRHNHQKNFQTWKTITTCLLHLLQNVKASNGIYKS